MKYTVIGLSRDRARRSDLARLSHTLARQRLDRLAQHTDRGLQAE